MYKLLAILGIFLLYPIAGCQATSPHSNAYAVDATTTPIVLAPVTSQPDPLDGTEWELMALKSKGEIINVPEEPRLFVVFNKGSISLRGGCNRVSGHYRIKNNRITITFAEATLVDCSKRMPGINEVERAFADAMLTFRSYAIDGDWLRIYYTGGEILLRRAAK